MERGMAAVTRGRRLIGTRFVAQGRDPAVGVDCIGLAVHAYRIEGCRVPADYRLAGDHRAAILGFVLPLFRRVPRRRIALGDFLLLKPGALQWHIGIWTGDGLLHADARRRMVVERPGLPEWPVAAAFRARVRKNKGI